MRAQPWTRVVRRVRWSWLARGAGAAAILTVIVLGIYTLRAAADLPDVSQLKEYRPAETTRIYSREGQLIATLFEENRSYVKLDKISRPVSQALIAIEDSRFYDHTGVDVLGIGRAGVVNLLSGAVEEGASTITMQLARSLFLTPERSIERKLKEVLLARRIEAQFSKNEILEMYLNEVYFGAGAYGIDSAANVYFGKSPAQLTVAESALLAGLVQAPSAINPYQDLQAARERTRVVLDRMKQANFLTAKEHAAALAQASNLVVRRNLPAVNDGLLKVPYFSAYAIHQLSQQFPRRQLYRQGLKIHTTVDFELQRRCERVLAEMMATLGPDYHADNAAAVLIDNRSGEIRAMVGGRGWSDKNQFNRAWQARRQPGSVFKAFVFAAALEHGYTPDHIVHDRPIAVTNSGGTWAPRNSDGRYMGAIPLRTALKFSRNAVAVQLIQELSPERVAYLAHRMGLPSDLPPYPSLALGAGEVTPLEMAHGFSVIARGGSKPALRAIAVVEDRDGRVVLDRRNEEGEGMILMPATAAGLTDMLLEVVRGGTGTAAAVAGHDVAGKTGTTDDLRDAWFVGFTPRYTLAVWVGNDDHSPMWGAYGGTLPAELFRELMTEVLQGEPYEPFPRLAAPAERYTLCADTRLLAGPACPRTVFAVFRTGAPQHFCTLHRDRSRVQVVQTGQLEQRLEQQGFVKVYEASPDPPSTVEVVDLLEPDYPRAGEYTGKEEYPTTGEYPGTEEEIQEVPPVPAEEPGVEVRQAASPQPAPPPAPAPAPEPVPAPQDPNPGAFQAPQPYPEWTPPPTSAEPEPSPSTTSVLQPRGTGNVD
ncbi:MAG: PBP1A family penicillin-binding protein [Armatimonadetes bacterium]|nr:PBP1A family penicillin-binding protein [Armatimonadota bacterium]